MRWAMSAAALIGLVGIGQTARAQDSGEQGYGEVGAPADLPAPSRVYRHTSDRGNPGVFTLRGDRGTALYTFNNQDRQDDLRLDRARRLSDGTVGWSYQVVRDGRPIRLWFFFAARPYTTINGRRIYKMFYSQMPDDDSGQKFWNRILVPNGTRMQPLDD